MKTVFTNTEIVHKFNEQNQNNGNTTNNGMFFNRTKIYSYGYHYLLCEFLDNNTVLINNQGYSNTTSKHISLITSATRNRKQYFTEQTDTQRVFRNITDWLQKLPRATKYKEHYISQINYTLKCYFEFLEYTKTKTKANKIKEHRQIVKISKDFYGNIENLEKQIKEQQKKKAIKDKKEIVQKLKDWKSTKIDWFRNKTNFDYLRLKDKETIETSQGVKISVNEAKRLLKLIKHKNILGTKVDNKYTVTAFNGLLKVGCHNIPLKEIDYIKGLI